MPKCPKCKKEIDYLKNYQSGENYDEFQLLNGERDYDNKGFEPDGRVNDYECPECSEIIFIREKEAVKFLKGEVSKK